jgi:ornithine cyclodeaminase/alanine dehydrogenase-like protein (mu-crystallin family)
MQFPGNFSGFVMLFASDTCAPYAIIHDHLLSPTRVAATSALASGLLARPASEVLGLIGGGEQALAHIDSHLDLFPALREIRVFIRTESSRSALEGRLSSRWNIDIKAVDTAREAVVACDIVIACTNAKSPVFSGSWLAPGQHVVTVASPDKFIRRQEIDAETVRRADIVMVNSVRQIAEDCQQPLLGLIESGQIMQNNLLELPIALKSDAPVRTGSDQITLYDNNVGMGVQFAALGKLLVERAIENGYVSEIPADIFLTRRTSESDRFAP